MQRKKIASYTAILCLGIAMNVGHAAEGSQSPKPFKLPAGDNAVVISLDYRGGYTAPRTGDAPTMSILADGTVLIPMNYQGQKAFEGNIEVAELQALLHFIVEKNEFFKFDAENVQKKLKKPGGLSIAIADAATTVVTVHVEGKSHEASHYALGFGGGKGQQVKELEQLVAVKNRLEQIRSTVQLGGKEKLAAWVARANKELKAKHAEAKPLTAESLQSGGERADGSVYVNFSRQVPSADAPSRMFITNVFINQPAEGAARTNVTYRDIAAPK